MSVGRATLAPVPETWSGRTPLAEEADPKDDPELEGSEELVYPEEVEDDEDVDATITEFVGTEVTAPEVLKLKVWS